MRILLQSPVLFVCTALSWVLAGCVAPSVSVDRTENMPDYAQNIFLFQPEAGEDPRNVFPRVYEGLRNIGFEVTPIETESPLFGRQGTAFVLSEDGYFLSTAHTFRRYQEATIWLEDRRYEADIVKRDRRADLVLLKLREPPEEALKPLPIAPRERPYRMGEEVFAIGYPLSDILGRQPRLNSGRISATVGLRDDPDFIQVSIETQPGNSGSPVFNDRREVIGMMKGTLHPSIMRATGGSMPQNVNFALKNSIIEEFLEDTDIELNRVAEPDIDFESLSKSVAQIRSGIIEDGLIEANKLACKIVYHSVWELWYRFSYFQLIFFDMDTGQVVLVAGETRDQLGNTENTIIERSLAEVRRKLLE
ncbi:MAG: trypsin-like peptidase domain-containing protein [Opitutales bacterium]|nr:trypsin-like peptidase domain-containing protein [Opitutales bacterium]